MHSFTLAFSALAALVGYANAHGIVTKIIAAGTTYQGYDPSFQYLPTPTAVIGWTAPQTQDRGPVLPDSYGNADIICHKGATPAALSAPVAAGDTVALQWTEWPVSHKGPMIDYLAKCPGDCASVDKTALSWFKIDGVGMTSTSGTPAQFADDVMIANNNTWSVKIPSDIAPGNYVLRHETIALHQAQAAGGAQNYPQCINLKISGSGTANPSGVAGTALYKPSDAGIVFNLYTTYANTNAYTVPGPSLYSGATNIPQGGSGGSGGATPTAATSVAGATSKATSAGSSAGAGTTKASTTAPATTQAATTKATSVAGPTSKAAPASSVSSAASPNFSQVIENCAKAMAGAVNKIKRSHPRDFITKE